MRSKDFIGKAAPENCRIAGLTPFYLSAGESTPFELELDGHCYTSLSGKEEFSEIVRAVAEGRFEEELWTSKSEIVRSVGRIDLTEAKPVITGKKRVSGLQFCNSLWARIGVAPTLRRNSCHPFFTPYSRQRIIRVVSKRRRIAELQA
jgi:hypothetical protein